MARRPSGLLGRPGGSRKLARLRAYLRVNLVAIWSSVVALVALRVAFGPSHTIMNSLYALVACGILLLAAEVLAGRDRNAAAASVTIVATWVVSFAITWVSPFLAPVGLLALLLPLVVEIDKVVKRHRAATQPALDPKEAVSPARARG